MKFEVNETIYAVSNEGYEDCENSNSGYAIANDWGNISFDHIDQDGEIMNLTLSSDDYSLNDNDVYSVVVNILLEEGIELV